MGDTGDTGDTGDMDRRTVLRVAGGLALTATAGGALGGRSRAAAAVADPAVAGRWSAPFDLGGIGIHATLTHTGDVLLFQYVEGAAGVDHTSWAGTWNHRTGATLPAPLPYDRDIFCAGNNVLPGGRVFLAGGHDHMTGSKQDAVGVAETDTWSPATRTWTPGPLMAQKRWYPTTVGRADGRTLIFGGEERAGLSSDLVEEFDPVTRTLRRYPATASRPLGNYPRMFLAPDGRIVKVGPGRRTLAFNPVSATWSDVATGLHGSRTRGNAVLLPGATRVLAVGGQSPSGSGATGTAEILDLAAAAPSWTATGSLRHPRQLAQAVNLPDGTILLLGGGATFKYGQPVRTPELYRPWTGAWTPMNPQLAGRMYHATAVLLPDARVLSAGQDFGPLARHGEIFSPPYLFRGPRPVITSAPAVVRRGQVFTVATPQAGRIRRVTMVRPGSVTHQIDTDQREVPLRFTGVTGGIRTSVPVNPHALPDGYYLLFVLDVLGVPSIARWVRVV